MLTELITDVERLISVHGLDAVRDAVEFTGRHSSTINITNIQFNGIEYRLTKEQIAEIRILVNAGDKISAIKRFREFTGTFLKEAKDVIESRAW